MLPPEPRKNSEKVRSVYPAFHLFSSPGRIWIDPSGAYLDVSGQNALSEAPWRGWRRWRGGKHHLHHYWPFSAGAGKITVFQAISLKVAKSVNNGVPLKTKKMGYLEKS